ncbi:acetyl-CoA carboxylase biotin carboxyl carrier protein subunit [Sulfitobacter sediminilitoris]|uniref:acetyl-CoA carboxylase biotin carboxyl carrier protein subunit n=1 Tax=Sulfitobacter sediminilitoris TaxID=2698830 RepID=UPI00360D87B5
MTIIKAENAAIVSQVHVEVGARVSAGTVLIVTELMKMHHDICAKESGIITAIHVAPGDELRGDEPLLTFEPAEVDVAVLQDAHDVRADFTEFEARMALLSDEARPEAVEKRHAQGMRTARENIDDLFDTGSFTEYGALAVAAKRSSARCPSYKNERRAMASSVALAQ